LNNDVSSNEEFNSSRSDDSDGQQNINADIDNLSIDFENMISDWEDDFNDIEDFNFDEFGAGVQLDITDEVTPYDVFTKIWDDEVMQLILNSSNKYGEKLKKLKRPHTKNSRIQNFKEISRQIPPNSLEKVFSIIKEFNNDITLQSLQQELQDFALKWETLSQSLTEEYYNTKSNNSSDKEDYENNKLTDETILDNIPQESSCCKSSDKKCHICCFFVLVRYNLYTNAYPGLYLAYKLLLTLLVSQVSCERSFSKLKHVKTSICSTLSQQNLETLMLMSVEKKDILINLDNNDIINKISTKSNLLKKVIQY